VVELGYIAASVAAVGHVLRTYTVGREGLKWYALWLMGDTLFWLGVGWYSLCVGFIGLEVFINGQ
jgi:hypothetical protein